jgi:RNA polymerase sigma-70 factor (ECF subfamily)
VAAFASTRWSLVLRAQGGEGEALEALCRGYWYPLYAFVRRRGHDAEASRDLTQEFFARLLEKRVLDGFDRARGRFRTFLLAALTHFLANQRDRDRAEKRGGGVAPLSLDFPSGEDRYLHEPRSDLDPERLYERRFALAVIERAMARLRDESARAGQGARLERLKGFLAGGDEGGYAALAAELGMTEGAVKVAVHRLRRRHRELLRAEVADLVDDPAAVDEELDALLGALRG